MIDFRGDKKLKTELLHQSNFNVMVSRIGDVLVKALDKPLGYAIN
jgi:NADH-quinone oxidoreductase subunit B